MDKVKPASTTAFPTPARIHPGFVPAQAWTIALSYVVVAIFWIYFSDRIVMALAPDPETLTRWSTYKGMAFVTVTGGLLLLLIWRALGALDKAYRAVQLSEERFRLLAQATSDAAWDRDLASEEHWWSDGIYHLTGTPYGQPQPHWPEIVHPEDRERVEKDIRACIDRGASQWVATYRILDHSGEPVHVEARALLLCDEDGHPVRMAGGLTDISRRLSLETHLRKVQRMEAVGQLTGGLAHDFNNLLTVILGNAENLQQALQDQPWAREQAALILQAAERGSDLTRRLLTFARQQTLSPKVVDLKQLVSDLAPLLRRTLGSNIDMLFGHDAGLPAALVDPAQLEQALLNLCVNARDAMPQGGSLTITTVQTTIGEKDTGDNAPPPGRYLVLSVTDTGEGIEPSHLGHIFEPFYTTKAEGKGTGLGLAMVYGFIRQSGGHITVTSRRGQTTFRLYLPAADSAAEPEAPTEPTAITGGGESVLLVDDDDLVREFATAKLQSLGYRVTPASSGEDALQMLERGDRVDLLFTDMLMPGMSGRELARRARQLRPGLRVLFTTGFSGHDDTEVKPGLEDTEILQKPYSGAELDRLVRRALSAP